MSKVPSSYFEALVKQGQKAPNNEEQSKTEECCKSMLSTFFAYDGILSYCSCEKQLNSELLYTKITRWAVTVADQEKLRTDILFASLYDLLKKQKNLDSYTESYPRLIKEKQELKLLSDSRDQFQIIPALGFKLINRDYRNVNYTEWEQCFTNYIDITSIIDRTAKQYELVISNPVHARLSSEDTVLLNYFNRSMQKFRHELYNSLSHIFLCSNLSPDAQSLVDKSRAHLQRGVLDGIKLCQTIINEKDSRKDNPSFSLGIDTRVKELQSVSNVDKELLISQYVDRINLLLQ